MCSVHPRDNTQVILNVQSKRSSIRTELSMDTCRLSSAPMPELHGSVGKSIWLVCRRPRHSLLFSKVIFSVLISWTEFQLAKVYLLDVQGYHKIHSKSYFCLNDDLLQRRSWRSMQWRRVKCWNSWTWSQYQREKWNWYVPQSGNGPPHLVQSMEICLFVCLWVDESLCILVLVDALCMAFLQKQ